MADRRRVAPVLAAFVTAAALALSGCGGTAEDDNQVVSGFSEADDDGMHGAVLTDTYTWPEGTLLDSAGQDFDLRGELEKPLTLVFFGYTQCPDICNTVMSDLALAVARLPAEAADDVQVVLVTSDPARDDPPALRAYLDRFDPDFTGLTGDLDTIVSLSDSMGVSIERGERLPSGGYEVAHGTQVVGYVGDRGVVAWTAGTSAEDIGDDLVQLTLGATAAAQED